MAVLDMDVILDTNIYYALIYAHGGQFTSANHFVELITYLKRTNSNLVVPTLVLDELSAKYKREFSQQVKDARDAYESMTRNMMDEWQNFPDPDIDEQLEMLRLQLLNPSKGFKSQIVDAYKNISTEEVAHRGIERIRPASAKGGAPARIPTESRQVGHPTEQKRRVKNRTPPAAGKP